MSGVISLSTDVWLIDETIRENSAAIGAGGLQCEGSELNTSSVDIRDNDPDQVVCDECTGDCIPS